MMNMVEENKNSSQRDKYLTNRQKRTRKRDNEE
jgi:hypothetical protein